MLESNSFFKFTFYIVQGLVTTVFCVLKFIDNVIARYLCCIVLMFTITGLGAGEQNRFNCRS